jgi:DMSO reductase anchor subunit
MIFTGLAIAGAGMILSAAWRLPVGGTPMLYPLGVGTVLMALSLVVSLGHLGRQRRAALALRGAAHSALSREILLASATTGAGFALIALAAVGFAEPWSARVVSAIAALFLVSIGLVYRIGGQRTWGGATVLLPLTAGWLLGEYGLLATSGAPIDAPTLVWNATVVDALMFAERFWGMTRLTPAETARIPGYARLRHLITIRFVALDLLPFAARLIGWPVFALASAVVGLAADRWQFYAFEIQQTTESEIARVEDMIEAQS